MARLRVSWRTSLTAPQQARNPQSESIARNPYQSKQIERQNRRGQPGRSSAGWRGPADDTMPHEGRIAVKLLAKIKGRIIRLGLRLHDALFPPDWVCLCSPCSRSHACGGAIHNEHA